MIYNLVLLYNLNICHTIIRMSVSHGLSGQCEMDREYFKNKNDIIMYSLYHKSQNQHKLNGIFWKNQKT